ncbi:antibiotic biosynthesis monooxygenase [Streptomyces sp. DK15]|uniref:antibiotic biosynthesis monooxygenase n=1 Tax=Streptomyces sp. DK15 TaxID=2957499 RepID=UPI0029B26ECB|nr:antibiotic biosynthesis monooxygenase [Streptomyces sp. DK15]MDX2394075.1 antibiotic biosynthesis monooxygenase [Streptomyces sp. DK15]
MPDRTHPGSVGVRGTVLAGRADVALIAARVVEPGHEEAFRQWARDVLAAAAAAPGNLGGGLFQPAKDGGPWIFVHRFRDHGTLQEWTGSAERAALFTPRDGHRHTEVARRELTGLEGWFTEPGSAAATPPRWKTAVSSALGIFPVSLVGSALLTPHLTAWPAVARTAVFAVLFSVLMTYFAMPAVTLLLRRWLSRSAPTTP